MDKKRKIFLKDLLNKNIYVKLEPKIQRELFSKLSAKDIQIPSTNFSSYKLKNHSVPLDLLFKILNILKIEESLIYKDILEIKYGERSKPILKPKFPIIKDPIYWNILFALFCDGRAAAAASYKST
jgi:hypothetical protein